jgi:glycosyltransferase involved in cell wall biosynthesis
LSGNTASRPVPSETRRRVVLMVGTSLAGQGGVASVLRTWRDAGLFERAGVRYVATNGASGAAGKAWQALRAWVICAAVLLFRRASVVHVHTSSYASFWRKTPVMAMALALRTPLIISLHGGAFRAFYASRGTFGRGSIRFLMRRAARFVVLTVEWRRWAQSVEPRARVVVIPNTVADSVAAPTPARPDDGRFERGPLLFLGRIEHEKGLWFLIDALAASHAAGAPWALVCAGTGDLAGAGQAVQRAGLPEDAVRFVGWIDGAAKDDWLTRCEALVLPSLIENMPVAILEAYAHGRPVIATRVGGIPDMLNDGEEGSLVEPADAQGLAQALIQAWRDGEAWREAGSRARERFERDYACGPVLDRVMGLYLSVVDEGRPSADPNS